MQSVHYCMKNQNAHLLVGKDCHHSSSCPVSTESLSFDPGPTLLLFFLIEFQIKCKILREVNDFKGGGTEA